MCVCLQRLFNGRMAEPFRDGNNIHAAIDENSRVAMAQVMQSDFLDAWKLYGFYESALYLPDGEAGYTAKKKVTINAKKWLQLIF